MTGTQFLGRGAASSIPTRGGCCSRRTPTPRPRSPRINKIGLDHYLLKPWEPPTERLYPVLEDLLSDWFARCSPAVRGDSRRRRLRCRRPSYAVKDFLSAQSGAVPVGRHGDDAARARARLGDDRRTAELPSCCSPTAARSCSPQCASWPRSSGCRRARRSRSTTRSSSAADRRVSPPPSTARPKDCARFSSSRRAGRPGGHQLAHRELPRISGRRDRR